MVVPLVTLAHAVPFHRRIVPVSPTAHTSFGPWPHTLYSSAVLPLGAAAHEVPFQRRMVPPLPTAHTSQGPLPQAP